VALANLFRAGKQVADLRVLVGSGTFRDLDSDAKFAEVFSAFEEARDTGDDPNQPLQPANARDARERRVAQVWHHSSGTAVMRVKATERAVVLSIDNRVVPGFSEYLISEMENLVSAYLKRTVSTEQATGGAKRPKTS
jgi:hypothetical protein